MSRIIFFKRDLMTVLGLALLIVCMIGIVILTSTSVKEIQLMYDARAEAKRWATGFNTALQTET
ncbi:MAG TPA: hypothetical protein ENH27_01300, partial [Rhizobiales bacterium]|nr:hypothetical protein [Hyphomicrobiales bacterium]